MKQVLIFICSLISVVVISSCDSQTPIDSSSNPGSLEKAGKIFIAHLSGGEEVPPVQTSGTGQAFFKLSEDGAFLEYKLIVANIENVTQSHIHLAPAGTNGAVVAFLFGNVPGGVTVNGVLAEGTITAANLVGPLAGQPLSALVDHLNNEGAYVNVHTTSYPGGEIRGQLQ